MIIRGSSPLRERRGMGTVGVVLLVLLTLIVAAGIGALLGYYIGGFKLTGSITEAFEPPFGGKSTVYILVLGEDDTGGRKKSRGLSDTIILASVDLDKKRVAALSIPRDTKVDLDGYGEVCKINAAHVYGGPTLTELAVERLIGMKPDYYVKTNTKGFSKSVDILGGVEIDVERNMRYTDRWGGLYINLKKGRQLLDGDKAMQYVRFRHDALGDIARIERQQKFLKALAEKALSPANLPKLPRIVGAILRNVETDLTPRDAIYLARFASRINLDEVEMATLPGTPRNIGGISYWIADPEQSAEVLQNLFFPRPAMPKIEVLNGSGVSGAAQTVADILKQYGYEVISIGNADSFDYATSQVISHNDDTEAIARVASIVNSSAVKHDQNASAKADITVIVGKDYALIGSGG